MNYLSPEFAAAFVLFFVAYWSVNRWPLVQKGLLLTASYAFYAAFDWRFALILAGFSTVLLSAAANVPRADGGRRRWPAVVAILAAIVNLLVFKYFNFFREELQLGLNALGLRWLLPPLDILLPVGISFYTFQGVAYVAAVARGERGPARWLDGAVFLAFFPTLLSGPICRPKDLLEPLEAAGPRQLVAPDLALWLIVLAIAKKVWLAAWLANTWANPVFANPDGYHALELLAGLYAYALQIYLDFSGYTDIVTALALLLGYRLPMNFNQPYLATSLRDFWRRWHMSLSSWIRDFVYIPLGGSRCGFFRAQFNTLAAMLVSGLWHGANITYVLWGAWHGLGLVLQNLWERLTGRRDGGWLSAFLTFHFVCLGWLFFRADSWETIQAFLRGFLRWNEALTLDVIGAYLTLALFVLVSLGSRQVADCGVRWLRHTPWWLKPLWLVPVALLLIELAPEGMPAFIYFQY